MPFINVYSSAPALSPERSTELLTALSSLLARELHKPEAYVMTCLMPPSVMTFAGNDAPALYAELKNIGPLSADTTQQLSEQLCKLLSDALSVPKNRIYIEFQTSEPHLWGFDGETFA